MFRLNPNHLIAESWYLQRHLEVCAAKGLVGLPFHHAAHSEHPHRVGLEPLKDLFFKALQIMNLGKRFDFRVGQESVRQSSNFGEQET